MPEEYFFVSDLHIGGDGQLQLLDFEEEFIALPQRDTLEAIPKRTVIG